MPLMPIDYSYSVEVEFDVPGGAGYGERTEAGAYMRAAHLEDLYRQEHIPRDVRIVITKVCVTCGGAGRLYRTNKRAPWKQIGKTCPSCRNKPGKRSQVVYENAAAVCARQDWNKETVHVPWY